MALPYLMNSYGPDFFDIFPNFYRRGETYLPLVDLREYAFNSPDKVSGVAQHLISQPEVQKIFSAPLAYQWGEVTQNNETLKRHGFSLLSTKNFSNLPYVKNILPFYNVVEHRDLQGWLIKAGGDRVQNSDVGSTISNDQNEFCRMGPLDGLLRVPMRDRIAAYAREKGIELVLPDKRIISYITCEVDAPPTQRYCVLCQKLDIMSEEESILYLKRLPPEQQKQVALNICTLIECGIVDAALTNFRFMRDGKLAFIDSESWGLLSDVSRPCIQPSVEKCARIGLYTFANYCRLKGLTEIANVASAAYEKKKAMKVSVPMVIASIVCPLIPIILVIVAIVMQFYYYYRGQNALASMQKDPKTNELKKWFDAVEGTPFIGNAFIKHA